MGQYYNPTIISKTNVVQKWWYSHDCQSEYIGGDGNKYTSGSGLKLMEHSWRKNDFVSLVVTELEDNPQRLVWAGDYADPCKNRKTNVYDRCTDAKQVQTPGLSKEYDVKLKYIINHDTKEFVNLNTLPKDSDGWQVHALPLLTCEGNGRGGGDYHKDGDMVGTWARHLISSTRTKKNIPKDFTEIHPTFCES